MRLPLNQLTAEFPVYDATVHTLIAAGWSVLCACPPGGTDGRYPKCVLPRRLIEGPEKGPRDEVDIMAIRERMLLVIEAKPRLSDSLRTKNALGENDWQKLQRLMTRWPPEELRTVLERGMGRALPELRVVVPVLAVSVVDDAIPSGAIVINPLTAQPTQLPDSSLSVVRIF